MDNFEINNCDVTGCIHYYEKTCWLNGQPIKKWMNAFQYIHTGDTCKVREQINKIKVNRLLEG